MSVCCTVLQILNLAGNRVRSLQGLAGHDLLETIDLEDNEVTLADL